MNENQELFSDKNKKLTGKFNLETPKNIWIDELICLRPKAYSFNCKLDNESKNKMKCISNTQSIHINFEEYKKSSDGEDYQKECDNYILRPLNHEMYLQKINKSTLYLFDDKRCYLRILKVYLRIFFDRIHFI